MPKRKHTEDGQDKSSGRQVKIALADPSKTAAVPCLATFPGTKPPADTTFHAYRSYDETKDEQRYVRGETEKVEFTGANFGEQAASNLYCKYLVGVYSKSDQTLTVTPAPLMRMRPRVKDQRSSRRDPDAAEAAKADFNKAKSELGMAFGTAKAQRQIRERERNEVAGTEIADVVDDIHAQVKKVAQPTQDEIREAMRADLPIPKHNPDADSPDAIYDMDSIVTESELLTLTGKAKELLKAKSKKEVAAALPYSSSQFINTKIWAIVKGGGKKDRDRLRLLLYISYLMAYLCNVKAKSLKDRRKIESQMANPPFILIDKMNERYTDKDIRTPFMLDKLQCYLMVLCLSVSNYTIASDRIAHDLSIKGTQIQKILQNLGCKSRKCTKDEASTWNLKDNAKVFALQTPLKLPDVSRRRR